jgi:hypothetical protein
LAERSERRGNDTLRTRVDRPCKKALLRLWSYSNVLTSEEGSNDEGDGRELCDLLVVFGKNVLLFLDKHCDYQTGQDGNILWPLWY